MLRMRWRSRPPMQARLKAKAQYTLATSSKIEQCFQQVSIGFLDGGQTSYNLRFDSPLNRRWKSAPLFKSYDEKSESRIQQSHRKSRVTAEMRARFSQWLLILREGATADSAGRGRSVHKRNPLRIPVARRPTHLIANGGIAQMRAHAAARLWRKSFPARNERPLS